MVADGSVRWCIGLALKPGNAVDAPAHAFQKQSAAMQPIIDDMLYRRIAEQFVADFLVHTVQTLRTNQAVLRDDVCAHTRDVDDLVFNLAFHLLQLFESYIGIDVDGEKYFAQCLFSREPGQPSSYVATNLRGVMHGAVSDELINAAFDHVCAASSSTRGSQREARDE